jgi:two-component system chemotaxis response regulator CheY
MRDLARDLLRQLGYSKFYTASDGLEALQIIYEESTRGLPIELVISDWNMPNMTGFELLQEVRKNPATKTLPFLLLTSENEQSMVIDAIKSGVSSYLIKPLTKQILESKLEEVFKHIQRKR